MTAFVKIGDDREDDNMILRERKRNQGNIPEEPDEGWWAAVLADEPKIAPQIDQDAPIVFPAESTKEPDGSKSSVNWIRVKQIFINDEIVKLNVVGYNRGGVLVADEDIHGFVPASHLIDLPGDLSEEDREQYLTSYLDRNISLKVIECAPDKERIVFSERAALAKEGQRMLLLNNLKPGDVVEGLVTNVTEFGAFVDLGGLEGLIHVSELSWGRVQHPSDIVKVDDKVRIVVLQVAEDEGKIALSLKQLKENPWKILSEKLSTGDVVEAVITSIVNYGAFARLDEGVEGLIHISSMNFPKQCTHIHDFLYDGQPVKVVVLSIDARKRRLGLKLESY